MRGDSESAINIIDDVAQHNLLTTRTRSGEVVTWSRHQGVAAALNRALVGRRGRPFLPLQDLRATVVDQPDGSVRIRVLGRLVFPSRLVTGPTQVLVVAGFGAAALWLGMAVPDPGMESTELFGVSGSALTILGATTLGVRSYRATITAMDAGFDHLFDRIERHAPRPIPDPERTAIAGPDATTAPSASSPTPTPTIG